MVLGGWVWFADGGGSEHLLPGRGACAAGGFWVSIRNKLHLGVPKQDSRETKMMSERERERLFLLLCVRGTDKDEPEEYLDGRTSWELTNGEFSPQFGDWKW